MAVLSGSDIVFIYSGGGGNSDPKLSLGGEPSSFPITSGLNNLFIDVSQTLATNGGSDYRAIYVLNNSLEARFVNAEIFIHSQVAFGADISIGMSFANDVQEIRIPTTVTSGSLDLTFEGTTFTWTYNTDLNVWAAALETIMNSIEDLSGVTVSVATEDDENVFVLTFADLDANRNQFLLELDDNNLVPAVDVVITKLIEGKPFNAVADTIPLDTVVPTDITFTAPDSTTPMAIGTFRPLDQVAVWIRRSIASGTQPIQGDGAQLRLRGSPF